MSLSDATRQVQPKTQPAGAVSLLEAVERRLVELPVQSRVPGRARESRPTRGAHVFPDGASWRQEHLRVNAGSHC